MGIPFTVAAASIKLTPLDFEGNREQILEVVEQEKQQKTSLVCFPELCITGYGCEDGFYFPETEDKARNSLQKIAQATGGIAIAVGLPLTVQEKLYNCAVIIADEKILAVIPKQHLAGDGIHYEPRWFTPYQKKNGETISLFGEVVPFGECVVMHQGRNIAVEICEDAWVEDRPAAHFKEKKVDIILNPSASHFARHKYPIRLSLVEHGSKLIDGTYVFANQLGNEAGRAIYDGDGIIASRGVIVAATKRFYFGASSVCRFEIPDAQFIPPAATVNEDTTEIVYAEFARAAALGLFDYLRKSGAKRFVLSLSGGADSAATALLVRAMVVFGIQDLGMKGFLNQLPEEYRECASVADVMEKMLHCVYQGTMQSSSLTHRAAEAVAKMLSATFSSYSIQEEVNAYRAKIEQVLGRELNWEEDNITLQNIQARVRSPGIWMVANALQGLLLTTANRSEASVGYTTMDGDSSGSLAPIAGVSKHFIQQWLLYLENNSVGENFGPFPGLSIINKQAPTAELKPLDEMQTDEADLMPYPVLAFFEQQLLFKREKTSIVLAEALTLFQSQYQAEELSLWLEKFKTLWRVSQWKRDRFAPSFHLDEFSVDSRTWFRFPILSKGL